MASRPRRVKAWYHGIPYSLDLVRCRRALVDRQVEGDLNSMERLADVVGISRSTASRFFSGRPTSLVVTLQILDALHLKFDDVARPETEDDDEPNGAGELPVTPRLRPSGGRDGEATRPEERKTA